MKRAKIRLKIISGRLKGISIEFPLSLFPETGITSQKMKEAIFSIISSYKKKFLNISVKKNSLFSFQFLDLFAGSGQIGLEALSRGFSTVLFNEMDNKKFLFLKKTVQQVLDRSNSKVSPNTCKFTKYNAFFLLRKPKILWKLIYPKENGLRPSTSLRTGHSATPSHNNFGEYISRNVGNQILGDINHKPSEMNFARLVFIFCDPPFIKEKHTLFWKRLADSIQRFFINNEEIFKTENSEYKEVTNFELILFLHLPKSLQWKSFFSFGANNGQKGESALILDRIFGSQRLLAWRKVLINLS